MKYDARTIHNPSAQPPLQRTLWGFVTAAFWLFYLYLLMPFLTLLLWAMGIRTAFYEMYVRKSEVDPFLMFVLPMLAGLCAVLLVGWASYNRMRFGGVERRRRAADVPKGEVAFALGASQQVSLALSESKVATLHMDECATPIHVTRLS